MPAQRRPVDLAGRVVGAGEHQQAAQHGGGAAVVLGLATVAVKVAGGLLALALVRPWGRVIPRRWLLTVSAAASALLVVYGAVILLTVAVGSETFADLGGILFRRNRD